MMTLISHSEMQDTPVLPQTRPQSMYFNDLQVLRADQFSRDFGSMMADKEFRAQLKPEMIWQIETGLKQEDKEVRTHPFQQRGGTRFEDFRASPPLHFE